MNIEPQRRRFSLPTRKNRNAAFFTSDYSFGYVAGWSSGKELAELRGSLETIRNTAAEMINAIDGHFAELQKTQEKEKAQPQHEGSTPEQPEAAPQEKAAFTPETIYRVRRNPYSDREENAYLLQTYVTQENGRAKMGEVLFRGTPEKCRELLGQLNAGELTEGQVKELYARAQEQPETRRDDTFSIYQLKDGEETRDYRFEPYDRLQAAGLAVDRANYELVYTASLAPGTSLDDIFTRFNIDHPKDFKGHSLSVSDVVVLHQDGQDTAHYVDRGDFKQIPEFLQEKQPQFTPDDLETGEKIQTPRGTFYVTGMSREQMEAAGYAVLIILLLLFFFNFHAVLQLTGCTLSFFVGPGAIRAFQRHPDLLHNLIRSDIPHVAVSRQYFKTQLSYRKIPYCGGCFRSDSPSPVLLVYDPSQHTLFSAVSQIYRNRAYNPSVIYHGKLIKLRSFFFPLPGAVRQKLRRFLYRIAGKGIHVQSVLRIRRIAVHDL